MTEPDRDSRRYRLKKFKYNSHYWIQEFLSGAKRPSKILDVGTADGYLGAILKSAGHHLIGVEADRALADIALPHYDTLHMADVEKFDFSGCGEVDYILLADILEHVRDPLGVLRRVRPCLKPGGEIILSIPNIAHLFIRMSLMLGRFEYQERGILDENHLRFFTWATVRRMVQEASFRIVEVRPTPAPIQLVFPCTEREIFMPLHELHFLTVRLWKTLLAYQFVARLAPEPKEFRSAS